LTLHSDVAPTEARLFHVQAPTKDFRDAHWTFAPMQKAEGGFRADWPAPASGYAAIFGEAQDFAFAGRAPGVASW